MGLQERLNIRSDFNDKDWSYFFRKGLIPTLKIVTKGAISRCSGGLRHLKDP